MSEELHVEVGYVRRYVTGQFQHKEYSLKLAGAEKDISAQLAERKNALAVLMSSMEGVVVLAHEAHQAGKTVEEILNVDVVDNSKPTEKTEEPKSVAPAKKPTKDAKLDDIF